MNRDRPYYVQLAILAILTFAYFDVTQFAVNEGRGPLLLAGVVMFALGVLVPLRLGPNTSGGREMIAVMIIAALAFFIPLSTTPPIEGTAAAAAALGLLVSDGLWALHRYPPAPESSTGHWTTDIGRAVRMGLLVATGFSIFAGIIFAIGAAADSSHAADVGAAAGLTVAGYFVGAVVAGTLAGLLRPVLTWPLGVMCAGILWRRRGLRRGRSRRRSDRTARRKGAYVPIRDGSDRRGLWSLGGPSRRSGLQMVGRAPKMAGVVARRPLSNERLKLTGAAK